MSVFPQYKAARQVDLFAATAQRTTLRGDSIAMTQQSLQAYGAQHEHWVIAWSGGKDSTATVTLVVWMIEQGMVPAPKKLTILYADTRMELPPLAIAAEQIMTELQAKGVAVHRVCAEMDKRFFVYMLGRGVPPPNNGTLRWCTPGIKIYPMQHYLETLASTEQFLMITGVRQGESAIRDQRIEMSCSKDGAECGQGWYQQVLPNAKGLRGRMAVLAPILHWRVCHVWDWLRNYAPDDEYGGFSTRMIADAYGGDEAEEINARTGCIGCPLASKDKALETVCAMHEWNHLSPLLGLKSIYRELREPKHRIRKIEERNAKGRLSANPQRMGPLKLKSRLWALDAILNIQQQVNDTAMALGRPCIDILSKQEEERIRELVKSNTWPHGWVGDEQAADVPLRQRIYMGGVTQSDIFAGVSL